MTSLFNFKPQRTILATSIILFLLALFASFTCPAQDQAKLTKSGKFSFDTEEINYGNLQQNSNGDRVFIFTNTGNAPIVISQVKTSCGCTVPTYSKLPVLPGEKGEIKVQYDTNRLGAFNKTITIISNATDGNKILRIKGNVLKSNHNISDTK
ncbi:DUF1573 domain-containing protein [Zhouia amylolytica]|uniref:DUF1573 domain-containing protein n=1 Tax=Zhouia amylolytica AD3 TaxID=1286632 RepID=W2UKT3_9FLAO|nr:DUF1573 domain-containing protein [Zhouia amylolytica]ETN93942.1 hypothetical protein P278_33530 [Zhouia amylolytica AD3]